MVTPEEQLPLLLAGAGLLAGCGDQPRSAGVVQEGLRATERVCPLHAVRRQ